MLSFATEFSVDANRTTADFLHAMVTWISGSPHTSLAAALARAAIVRPEPSKLGSTNHPKAWPQGQRKWRCMFVQVQVRPALAGQWARADPERPA